MSTAGRPITTAFFLTVALVLTLCFEREATAQKANVDKLIELVSNKPANMDRSEWKEQRRAAVRKLGNAGDKRAVPALIRIVETEEFDVVAEHAIKALGKLGDKRAVPVLQKVYHDKSRDRYVRDMARAALRKLKAGTGKAPATNGGGGNGSGGGSIGGGSTVSSGEAVTVPTGPKFAEGTLGATERITLAVGAARLAYDTLFERPTLDGNVRGEYERTRDLKSWAYRYGANAAVVGAYIDHPDSVVPESSGRAYALTINTLGTADARFYLSGQPIYGLLQSALGVTATVVKVDRPNSSGDSDVKETIINTDVNAGLGVGYGRVLDVGQALRLRRLEKVLEDSKMLGRRITPDLAERILRAWWTLRNELGWYKRLTITVKMLREAGVLLGEPDAGTSYKLLQVLMDGQLNRRRQGLDVSVSVAESYLIRDDDQGLVDGRFESALVRARFGKQNRDGTNEILGEGFARYRFGDSNPKAFAASGAWRKYFYGPNFDPIGALEIAGEIGWANDDIPGITSGRTISARLGWLWTHSRASRFRASATVSLISEELFIGAGIEATYGFLDVGFVGAGTYSKLGSAPAAR